MVEGGFTGRSAREKESKSDTTRINKDNNTDAWDFRFWLVRIQAKNCCKSVKRGCKCVRVRVCGGVKEEREREVNSEQGIGGSTGR